MLDPENIPTPINREECPMSMVSNTIILMNLMISRLMQKTYTSEFIDITESYIKMFLSYLDKWNSYFRSTTTQPIWISSYSFLNLLNLPNMMREYGPIRNFWEGSELGEGYLRVVKPLYIHMHKSWAETITKKNLQQKSLTRIIRKMSAIEYENGNVRDEYKDVAKNYYIYEQAIHVDLSLDKGDPISVIIDNDHRIWVMLKNGEAMNLVVEGTGENICDHYYFKFSIGFKCTAKYFGYNFFWNYVTKD